VAGATSKPVTTIRLPVDATPTRRYTRSDFGLREGAFTFLFGFDFSSFIARKNPHAVIEAFQMAFPDTVREVGLVLKSTNWEKTPAQVRELEASIAGDPRIRLLNGFMTRDQVYGLESVVDSYVSLHRSEGFGLGLAESMFLGKPVVGTAYSGNMEFMNAGNSCLVGYGLVPVGHDEYPHPEGQVWADPDLDQAAYYMRRLASDPGFGVELGRRARSDMQRDFSYGAVGERVARELSRILGGLPAS
jgi:glycosyltransferase involved in cell wall biosynthesis